MNVFDLHFSNCLTCIFYEANGCAFWILFVIKWYFRMPTYYWHRVKHFWRTFGEKQKMYNVFVISMKVSILLEGKDIYINSRQEMIISCSIICKFTNISMIIKEIFLNIWVHWSVSIEIWKLRSGTHSEEVDIISQRIHDHWLVSLFATKASDTIWTLVVICRTDPNLIDWQYDSIITHYHIVRQIFMPLWHEYKLT